MSESARAWLALADDDPDHAERWWRATGTTLLSAGRLWEAVSVAAERGRAAFGTGIPGPALLAPDDGLLYALVPVGTGTTWSLPGTECLGLGTYLTVPPPDHVAPGRTGQPYWLQPPTATGQLVVPVTLHAALSVLIPPEAEVFR